MQRRSLLYCSLLPSYFGRRREDRVLLEMVAEYSARFTHKYRLRLLLASAHASPLSQARDLLARSGVELETIRIPFEPRPDLSDVRFHEISHCKQVMARRIKEECDDLVLQIDADVSLPFEHLDQLADALVKPLAFVNVPYVIHNSLDAPDVQLGVCLHRRELLDEIDYTPSIYRTLKRDGKLHRHNAPDCAMRLHLLQHGAEELRAKPPAFSILTRHYSDNGTYGLYRAGKMSRHLDAREMLGFDPKLCSMAMDVESCTALNEYCRRRGVTTAIDLGTGAGNSYQCLRAAGAKQVTSVDESQEWTSQAKQLAKEHADAATAFLTRPMTSFGSVRTYNLGDLGSRRFDLVVIDGPQQNPAGRLAAASQLQAAHYAFHDANRDKEIVAAFVRQTRERGHRAQVVDSPAGRGMAFVAVDAA